MTRSLIDYRTVGLERILGILWRQWSALEVAGYRSETVEWVADPEALLALTCTMARYDARLFDEVLDWLTVNGRFVNVHRLKTLFAHISFGGRSVLNGIARVLHRHTSLPKWKLLIEPAHDREKAEVLFHMPDGRPIPSHGEVDADFLACGLIRNPIHLRGLSRVFTPRGAPSLLLRFRALVGVNARCEILLYLLTNGHGHSHEIARQTHYFQKTVYDALSDMECSGYVVSSKSGRKRIYRLTSPELTRTLLDGAASPGWVEWPSLFGAIERFWMKLDTLSRAEYDQPLLNSELYLSAKSFVESFNKHPSFPASPAPKANGDAADYIQPFLHALQFLGEGESSC